MSADTNKSDPPSDDNVSVIEYDNLRTLADNQRQRAEAAEKRLADALRERDENHEKYAQEVAINLDAGRRLAAAEAARAGHSTDTARLDWLELHSMSVGYWPGDGCWRVCGFGENLPTARAAIDAAMSAKEGGSK